METNMKTACVYKVLFAVALVLLALTCARRLPSAHAAGGGWGTDGFLTITATDNDRVVLMDTVHKQLMLYRTDGNAFRLANARRIDSDVLVEDSAGTDIEKKGVTRQELEAIRNGKKP